MMEYKISVIIPVYNTEVYLNQCIDSVLHQTYKNLEVILVDDGSRDGSLEICKQYKKKDNRITIIHQENGGLSYARNQGIKKATGEYITFLDSDDYWDDIMLIEKLVLKIRGRQPDIINYRYKHYYEDTNRFVNCLTSFEGNVTGLTKEEVIKILLDKGLYIASACNKLIRSDFLNSKQLYFHAGITSEDIDWCARILLTCESMDYCNTNAYVYRQRSGSITHTVKYESVKQLAENIQNCIELGNILKENDTMYTLYFTYVSYQYGVFLLSNHYARDKRTRLLRKQMKNESWLLQFRSNKKVRMLYYLNKYIGYAGMNIVMAVYSKVR